MINISERAHSKNPLIIAGPCSAETEDQVLSIAKSLKAANNVHLYRAGIWKPRTNPGSFEGVGEIGLNWLNRVQEEMGLPVCIEVANSNHVELALKYKVDALWIGARTSVNPFAVQEIADSLKGVKIPVMIKNPINPDLKLWMGAIHRIEKAGIEDVSAIHRGFSYFGKSIYRNKPMWEIPIQLIEKMSHIPVICDPSHMGGKRELIQVLSQRGLDLGMKGLMIETHCDPDKAWSDAAQQIVPERLTEILSELIWKDESTKDLGFTRELLGIRSDIDDIDEEIIRLLADRMKLSQKIGDFKKEHDIVILQLERWKQILQTRKELGLSLGLSDEFLDEYLNQLHRESIRKQTDHIDFDNKKGIDW